MTELALPSFEIQGFRVFDYLKLEHLGRVNLLVGKNNVGKTSLLEALWVYANQGSPTILWSLLEARNEISSLNSLRSDNMKSWDDQAASLKYLFHRRIDPKTGQAKIELGPMENTSKRVSVKYVWIAVEDEQGIRRNREVEQPVDGMEVVRGVAIQTGEFNQLIRLNRLFVRNLRDQFTVQTEWPCIFLAANGLSTVEVGQYWDSITLSALEGVVLDTMKIIEPDIERINLIGAQRTDRHPEDRVPIVKVRSVDAPFPLKSLGEGMNRLFGIALVMVNTKDGILLIDEIESGLHYSVLAEMWRFIFQTARRLNVQVFATTHSWDCIVGFEQAAQENAGDGMLIRLANKKGKIIPTSFDEKELAIATREQIEVR